VFGKVEDDDVISLLEPLIQLPLAPFSFDLRRTGHFESIGEEGEKRGGRREKKERWAGALMDKAMGYQESGEGTRQWYNPLHRIPRSTDNLTKKHRSHFGLHDQYRTGHVAQPRMYISQFKLGAVVVREIPYVGFPGPFRPMWTEAALRPGASDGNAGPGQKCGRRPGQSDGGVAYRNISCNHIPNA